MAIAQKKGGKKVVAKKAPAAKQAKGTGRGASSAAAKKAAALAEKKQAALAARKKAAAAAAKPARSAKAGRVAGKSKKVQAVGSQVFIKVVTTTQAGGKPTPAAYF